MENDVKVSVLMPTYNQRKYVEHAINSVLMQKTNFKYEVLVGDDCSTDGTQEILRQRYSNENRVRLLLREKNIGGTKNTYDLARRARGKYFILLEGDDYWNEVDMLQKMVAFLDVNLQYIGVGARIRVVTEREEYVRDILPDGYYDNRISLGHFMNGIPLHFRAVLWRNVVKDDVEKYAIIHRAHWILGDFTWCNLLLEKGSVYMRKDISISYRAVSKKGRSNYNSTRNWLEQYEDYIHIIHYLERNHVKKHDYDVICMIKTVKVLKNIVENMSYHHVWKVLETVGVRRFVMSLLKYKKYEDSLTE